MALNSRRIDEKDETKESAGGSTLIREHLSFENDRNASLYNLSKDERVLLLSWMYDVSRPRHSALT